MPVINDIKQRIRSPWTPDTLMFYLSLIYHNCSILLVLLIFTRMFDLMLILLKKNGNKNNFGTPVLI